MAEECVWLLSNRIASSPGIWPVDIFPFLKYIPTWVPGMAFKRNAIKWKAQMEEFVDQPFKQVQDNIVSTYIISASFMVSSDPKKSGNALPSFCKTLLGTGSSIDNKDVFDMKWTANSMYAGRSTPHFSGYN